MPIKNINEQNKTLYEIYSNMTAQDKQVLGLSKFNKNNIIDLIQKQIDTFFYSSKDFNKKYKILLDYLENFVKLDGQIINSYLKQKIINQNNRNIFKNICLKDIQEFTEKEYIKERILSDIYGLRSVIEDEEIEPEIIKLYFFDYEKKCSLTYKNKHNLEDYFIRIEKKNFILSIDYPNIEISVNIKTPDIFTSYITIFLSDNKLIKQIKKFINSDENKDLSSILNPEIEINELNTIIKLTFNQKHIQTYLFFLDRFLDKFQDLFKKLLYIGDSNYIIDMLIKKNKIIDKIIATDLNKDLGNILNSINLNNVFDNNFWGKLDQFLEGDSLDLSKNIVESFKVSFNPLEEETYFEISITDQEEFPIIDMIWNIDNEFKQYYIRANNNNFIIEEKYKGKVQDNISDEAIIQLKLKLKIFDIINKMLLAKILFDLGYDIGFNSNIEDIIKGKIKFEDIIKYVFVYDRFRGRISGFEIS